MKKSLIALAVLGSFAGVAAAQSSVTLFGILDVGVRHTSNGTTTKKTEDSGSESTSRWGLRGTEDLGGGLSAGFWLESGINTDNGTSSDTAKFWNRRSTVSLVSKTAGELRMGRDYNPIFSQYNAFSPFGVVGVGSMQQLIPALGGQDRTRSDNTVSYWLPSGLGGVYGEAMVAAGEGVANNKHTGGRLGYLAGPVHLSAAFGETQVGVTNSKVKESGLAASFDFGAAKVIGQYLDRKIDSSASRKTYQLAATAPLGNGLFKVAFTKLTDGSVGGNAKDFAVGYVHNLSKRTALYTTYARTANTSAMAIATSGALPGVKGQAHTGAEVGIRHSF